MVDSGCHCVSADHSPLEGCWQWQCCFMFRTVVRPSIYTIICLKSVDVRRLQVAILARSPREMSQTDRILPRYFLSRVRVSVRPRIFLYAKNSQTTVGPITDRPCHRPSERRNNLKGILYIHAMGATYVTIHTNGYG